MEKPSSRDSWEARAEPRRRGPALSQGPRASDFPKPGAARQAESGLAAHPSLRRSPRLPSAWLRPLPYDDTARDDLAHPLTGPTRRPHRVRAPAHRRTQ